MATLRNDLEQALAWIQGAFGALEKSMDYSFDSIKHIDDLIDEQFENGKPVPNGLFDGDGMGRKLWAIGAYVGETIIRNNPACKWVLDPKKSNEGMDLAVESANGGVVFPLHKVFKRVQDGDEENLYTYVVIMSKKLLHHEGDIPEGFFSESSEEDNPGWAFIFVGIGSILFSFYSYYSLHKMESESVVSPLFQSMIDYKFKWISLLALFFLGFFLIRKGRKALHSESN